jgi:type II secretory pathway component GspD/PulD (secretin)
MRATLLALAMLFGGAVISESSAQPPPPGIPRIVKIYKLKNADAEKLGSIVTTLYGRNGVTTTVDSRTNSLIVSGDEDTLKEVHKLVTKLDEPTAPKK